MDKPLLNNRFDRIRISGVTLNICYFLLFSGCPNGHPYVIGDVSLYINSEKVFFLRWNISDQSPPIVITKSNEKYPLVIICDK